MFSAAPLPTPLQGRSFTVRESAELGVTASRIRALDLTAPSRGIRVPRDAVQSFADRCRPYTDLLANTFISHSSAARFHDIPLSAELEQDEMLHLARRRADAVPRRRGVRGHRLDLQPEDITTIEGVPVTSAARTWLDLALHMTDVEHIVAGDFLVSAHQRSFGPEKLPIVSKAELGAFLERHPRSRGITRARRTFERLRVGVDSPPETRVRLMLEDAGLPEFSVNYPVVDSTGGVAFWTDLACPEYRTCIEYDGDHHLTPEQQRRDMGRDRMAAELDWVQVKLNRLDLRQGAWRVVQQVERGLERGGWAGGASSTVPTTV